MDLANFFSDSFQSKFSRSRKPEELVPQVIQKSKSVTSTAIETDETNELSEKNRIVETEEEKLDKSNRTLFIGNLATSITIKKLKKICSSFGEVDSIRLRSIPIAGTAVDKAGYQNLVRKVCAIKRSFGDQKGSMNAYVVFKDQESVEKAILSNNMVLESRHLRFDHMVPSVLEPRRTVFIGSLPHYVDEEELREHFSKV
jgi:nucleolar protein 12